MQYKKGLFKENIEVLLIIVTISLFIYRTAMPFFKYPFIFFYFYLMVSFIISYSKKKKLIIIDYIKTNLLLFILFSFLLLGFLLSSKNYLVVIKDLFNSVILLSLIFLLFNLITNKNLLQLLLKQFIWITIVFATIISLYNFIQIDRISEIRTDYNFALIPIFFGIISVLYILLTFKLEPYKCAVFNLLLICFTINILINFSRRGFVILLLIIFILIISQFVALSVKHVFWHRLSVTSRTYLLVVLTFIFSLTVFFSQSSYKFKNRLLEITGVTNLNKAKRQITSKVYRYYSIYAKNLTFEELLDKIWSHSFNPRDPESGWGTRNHQMVFPLQEKNNQIIPPGTMGYLMDSSTNESSWNNNAYSFTKFADVELNNNQKIISSVYCYVSEDFNGNWVQLNAEGSVSNYKKDRYDISKKGEWQKLEINPKCKKGSVQLFLYFSKYGVSNFSMLKGYVIFAYPTYKIIDEKDSIIYDASKGHSLLFLNNGFNQKQKEYSLSKASLINFSKIPNLLSKNYKVEDTDPIRNWIKNLVNEDTTYNGYKADINVNYNPKNPIVGRTARWKFAIEIYKKEYNWKQKIFGNGFDYLNWYGYYFYKDKTKSDWPHNPFLSVLLYSGIIGLGLYLYLMYKVIAIYLKYIREYYILFIFFGITFFFSFFSANSPFTPPVMGFLIMLPFFIDYIHKKDKTTKFAV